MNNDYYHQLSTSFNAWYVVAIVLLAIQAVIAYENVFIYHGVRGNFTKVTTLLNYRFTALVAIISGIIISILVYVESYTGIVQILLNRWGYDSDPFYAEIGALVCIVAVGVLYSVAGFKLAKVIQNKRLLKLGDDIQKKEFEKDILNEANKK